jgi:integrase
MRLTATTIRTLTLPPGVKDKKFFDERLPGFALRLREGGSRNWIAQFDVAGRTRTMKLGSVSELAPGEAFRRARDVLAARTLGRDPAAEKQAARAKAAETLGGFLPAYLAKQRDERRPRSFKELERHLVKYARPLHARPLTGIDRRAISGLISTIEENNGPSAAINAHGSLSGYFSWLMREGLLDQNPMPYTNKPKPRLARDRLISDDELRALWAALADDDYGNIIKLLVYTAARRNEIGDLRWDETDLDKAVIEIPASRMKNGKPHVIPLSDPALAILKRREQNGRDFVFGEGARGFQGWSWRRKDLDARIAGPRPDFVLHDFRRLVSTVMHEKLGIAPHVVEAVLAHVGHRAGVAGTYNKASYIDEKHRALTAWAQYVDLVTTGKAAPGKVVKLRA